jgi:site-specific DNA-cytosine methylase
VADVGRGARIVSLTYGSMCSGYAGLELGIQAVLGGETIWHVEYDKAPSKILEHHYPGVPNYGEWLMALPDGWVTDVPGISRNDQLKALGNGVVPPQAAAATRAFLEDTMTEARTA